MNQYKWFYKGKTGYVSAATSYEAQQIIAALCKTKKGWEVTVVIVEDEDGRVIEHSTTEF